MNKTSNVNDQTIADFETKIEQQLWNTNPEDISKLKDEIDLYLFEGDLSVPDLSKLKKARKRLDDIENKVLIQGRFPPIFIYNFV